MGNVHSVDRKTERGVKGESIGWKAARVSAALSILFLVVYGSCNWITAHRTDVGFFYFDWERRIPFVPLLIPAYLSIDLFFIGAPFLCRSSQELRVYSKRIAAAILVAGACFLLFPLRFAFARPGAGKVFGPLFDLFHRIDQPYNLFPSLHAALLFLVADVYVRHLRGAARVGALGWFVLIGLSPVLTYQHHVIDILGGTILAIGCFYFLPDRAQRLPVERNVRIGAYYIAGASTLLALVLIFRGWAILFLWPAIALSVVATSYFGGGAGVYRKTNGRLSWSARLVLAPCLLGQLLSLYYYRQRCRAWDAVTPRVWIGSKLTRRETNEALRLGVTAVLDLTAEFSEPKALRKTAYRNIPVLDLTAPTQAQLSEMTKFIADHVRTGIVYVHCKIGYSRSAAAVAAYLLCSGKAHGAVEAFAMIRKVRRSLIIRPEVIAALRQFESEHDQPLVSDQSFLLASTHRALA